MDDPLNDRRRRMEWMMGLMMTMIHLMEMMAKKSLDS